MTEDRNARMKEVLTTMFGTPDPTGGAMDDEIMRTAMEFCFGEIWSRPGLELKTRSIIVITLLLAKGAEDELKHHLKVGMRNGLTKDEIREMLLQVCFYAGGPTFAHGWKIANQVFAEVGV
jgi:4-carboxymuconolactone decarboxylase